MKFISAATKHNVDTTTEITRSIKILTRNTTNNRRHMVKWVRAVIPFLATVHLFHERTCYLAVIGARWSNGKYRCRNDDITLQRDLRVVWCMVGWLSRARDLASRVVQSSASYVNSYYGQIILTLFVIYRTYSIQIRCLFCTCSDDRKRSNGYVVELQRRDIKIKL